jgi:riboflavin synthase
MFTGIVREVGAVTELSGGEDGVRLVVEAPGTAPQIVLGGSVAIDGVCLTAVEITPSTIAFDAVPETLRRTSLARLQPGGRVNVEPALVAGDALGGHIVQGHVDGVGRIQSVEWEGEGLRVFVETSPDLLRYCVEKGSITVDGVSLTVAELHDDAFGVALVPHTLSATTFADLAPGREVNLEVDVLAKYVERLLAPRLRGSGPVI